MEYIGLIVDPWVINYEAYKVFEDDSIGVFLDPVFIVSHIC